MSRWNHWQDRKWLLRLLRKLVQLIEIKIKKDSWNPINGEGVNRVWKSTDIRKRCLTLYSGSSCSVCQRGKRGWIFQRCIWSKAARQNAEAFKRRTPGSRYCWRWFGNHRFWRRNLRRLNFSAVSWTIFLLLVTGFWLLASGFWSLCQQAEASSQQPKSNT